MWSEQRIQVSSKSLLLLAASVVVNAAGGKQVRRTGQEKDSVACRDSRMPKRAQSFGKDGWDAATGNLRGSAFQAEEPSPVEAATGRAEGAAIRGNEKAARWCTVDTHTPCEREGGPSHGERGSTETEPEIQRQKEKRHRVFKTRGKTNHRKAPLEKLEDFKCQYFSQRKDKANKPIVNVKK